MIGPFQSWAVGIGQSDRVDGSPAEFVRLATAVQRPRALQSGVVPWIVTRFATVLAVVAAAVILLGIVVFFTRFRSPAVAGIVLGASVLAVAALEAGFLSFLVGLLVGGVSSDGGAVLGPPAAWGLG